MKKYNEQQAFNEAEKMREAVEEGKVKSYAEAENILESYKLVPVTEIIPNIDTKDIPPISKDVLTFKNRQPLTLTGANIEILYNILKKAESTDPTQREFLLKDIETIREVFRRFKDQIVVDLGAGVTLDGYRIVETTGAKAYIAVEPFNATPLKDEFNSPTNLAKKRLPDAKHLKIAVVREDMLTFLKRLPDNSVSILVSGIDCMIIEEEYGELVAAEIERVLDPNGAFVEWVLGRVFDGSLNIIHPKSLNQERFNIAKFAYGYLDRFTKSI